MTHRIAILTPDPADEGYRTRWPEVLAQQSAPLEQACMIVEGRSWTESIVPKSGNRFSAKTMRQQGSRATSPKSGSARKPDGLADFDLVMPLLVWGYHRAPRQWRQVVRDWDAQGVRVRNPPSVLQWNADKTYLGRLAEHGAPVVPTIYADSLTEALLHEAAAQFGTDRLIAKPQASASAWQTIVWASGRSLDGGPTGAAMIQPYLPSIETSGEISLVYIDGVFSHAIDKKPRQGDFRVQPEHGAILRPHRAVADEIAAAEAILAAIDEPLLYARVDLVRGLDHAPALMEIELVEPDLSLEHDPGRGAAFVAAVRRAASA